MCSCFVDNSSMPRCVCGCVRIFPAVWRVRRTCAPAPLFYSVCPPRLCRSPPPPRLASPPPLDAITQLDACVALSVRCDFALCFLFLFLLVGKERVSLSMASHSCLPPPGPPHSPTPPSPVSLSRCLRPACVLLGRTLCLPSTSFSSVLSTRASLSLCVCV